MSEALTPALNEAAKALAEFTRRLAKENKDHDEGKPSDTDKHLRTAENRFMNLGHGLRRGQIVFV